MRSVLQLLILAPVLSLVSCNEEDVGSLETSAREARARQEARVMEEVERRVDVIRGEMKTDEIRWHTVRVACFCLLAGGSLIALMSGVGLGDGAAPARRTVIGHNGRSEPQPGRRVIDRPYDPYDDEDDPYRR